MKSKYLIFSLIIVVLFSMLMTGCASTAKKIAELESVEEHHRTEEQWIRLAELYEKEDRPPEEIRALLQQAIEYCSSNDKIRDKLDSYLQDAPTVDISPGVYDGRLSLCFTIEPLKENQELYITRNCDENISLREIWKAEQENSREAHEKYYFYAKSYDKHTPESNSYKKIGIWEPGTYVVRAGVLEDGIPVTKLFEGEYTLKETDFSSLSFNLKSGTYAPSTKVNVTGAGKGKIYYTTDGSDPLHLGYDVVPNGELLTAEGISIVRGYNQIKIRCIAENGAVSPIIEQTYNGKIAFDSTDWYTAEDGKYEYVCGIKNDGIGSYSYHSTGTVFRYPKDGTALHYNDALFLYNAETKKNITSIAICTNEAADGSLQHTLQMIHNKSTVYTDVLKDGEKGTMTKQENTKAIYKEVGNGWRRYRNLNGTIKMDGTYATGGDQKIAEIADLLTDDYAIWCVRKQDKKKNFMYNYTVYMANPNGNGEGATLWTTQDEVVLDAIIGSKLLYHYDDTIMGETAKYRHMVYDLKTGEHRERTDMTSSYNGRQYTLVGYTSEAAYVCGLSVGEVVRIPIDYDAL